MPLFNDNKTSIDYSHPGYVSGKYYASVGTINNNIGNLGCVPGYVYYTYFYVAVVKSFQSIAFLSPSTFASTPTQLAHIGIYKVESGLPSTLVNDCGEVVLNSTTGVREKSCLITLPPGWYAIALSFSPNAINIVYPLANLNDLIGQTFPSTNNLTGLRAILAYSSIYPFNASRVSLSEQLTPLVWLKAM